MLIFDFFIWWYGRGWIERISSSFRNIQAWAEHFSLGLLLRTLFSPWRQMSSTTTEDTAMARFMDRSVSRFVGFWVRLFTFFAGLVLIIFISIFSFILFLVWPLIPPGAVFLIVWGLM